ncbi:CRISPR-associated helicase/endonuclease Cas3 [Natranaerobius trueperi]|uniref:CRISPR-associated helicase/endonuclease Cas3 n=1 Tax=Natranaerobius trueperi TaxID=759412 RepID=A0A226BXX3_9FIRM|nr:CRISPR-associated helicase/endonuclease Cas3 [Natranaerobius trueperi]OWZ83863.1 CRISPR-associated helicase/endonuclease Cas3 [Natranaerobius trueperi]
MDYIAHIRDKDGCIQSVQEHLSSVGKLSSRYGEKIGVKQLTYIVGWLHDLGKMSSQFKEYILGAVEDQYCQTKKGSIDHSTAGGKLLFEFFHQDEKSVSTRLVTEILSNVILSHHTGLIDYLSANSKSDFLRRIKEKEIDDYSKIKNNFLEVIYSLPSLKNDIKKSEKELEKVLSQNCKNDPKFTISLLTKYIFSCLIDADRTDARCFDENITLPRPPNNKELFQSYYLKLIDYLNDLNNADKSESKINNLRRQMSEECDCFADKSTGIYTLSIPTGGGKTLSSLRYALKHAVKYNKDRIIYVVPYTSIIEQNAEEVRSILGDDGHIIEHHSNVIEDTDEENLYEKKKRHLTRDNWDVPIVFTTMVQFLNAFYSKKTRDTRRLHNLANSIVIFDEVQSVPVKCISMFNQALNFLKNVCDSSLLLCTATQPALEYVENNIDSIDGEIISKLEEVEEHFKRVEIVDKTIPSGWSTEEITKFIIGLLNETSSILTILNTKTVVKKLYDQLRLNCDVKVYHLSTSMCAAHRAEVLKEVKNALNNGEKVICISTQLIEAGVDISFNCVIRSLAGLDSIAQAAGRCNRHNDYYYGNVFIINHNEENLNKLKTIKVGAEITEKILIDKEKGFIENDLLSGKIMYFYFKNYFKEFQEDLNYTVPSLKENLFNLLVGSNKYKQYYENKTGDQFPLLLYTSMKTEGDYFQVIDQPTRSVLVPYKKGAELIAELNGEVDINRISDLINKSQHYIVNIFDFELQKLSETGSVTSLLDGEILALRENAYDINYGISTDEEGKMNAKFI